MLERIEQGLNGLIAYFSNSQLLFAIIIGLAIAAFFLAVISIVNTVMNPARRQLRSLGLVGKKKHRSVTSDWLVACVRPFGRVLLPRSEKELGESQRRLAAAGFRRDSDIVYFFLFKMLLSLVLGIGVLVGTTYYPELSGVNIVFFVCLGFGVGMLIPGYVLDKLTNARKARIVNGFPDMLDLMVACSEAGLGLNAGLQRVSREIYMTHPDLAKELEMVNSEMLAGIDRVEALKGLSDRTGIDDITGFVSMLCQSVRFGTGIADTLRIYAEEFRDKRMQRAEEAAEKVGTKLLFPLVLCMFPSFFVVAVGPAMLSIMKAFSQ